MSYEPHRPASEPPPEVPRAEPEIIPPNRDGVPRPGDDGVFIYTDPHGNTRRATFKPPSTFAIVLAMLIAGLVGVTILVLVLGFVLIWVPIAIIAVAGLVLAGRIRGAWQRMRSRA